MEKFEIHFGTLASTKPEELVAVNDNVVDINLNVENITIDNGEEKQNQVKFDCFRIRDKSISINEIINALIRTKYSESEELSILRQKDTKNDEFDSYNDFCEESKALGKEIYSILHK